MGKTSRATVLYGSSALQYWGTARCRNNARELLGTANTRRRSTRTAIKAASFKPCHTRETPLPPGCTTPLHVTATNKAARVHTALATSHLCTAPLPEKSLVRINNHFATSTPELAFCQMASTLTLSQLIMLGYELCGTYATRENGATTFDVARITTADKLASHVSRFPRFRGRAKAQRAVHHILDNSASPRESQLAIMLTLPYRLGGYGFSHPQLNHPISVASKATGKRLFVLDAYWPDIHLNLEYDSDRFHTAAEKIALDGARRAALESIGITSINVSNSQLRDSGAFNQLAKQLASIAGKRLCYEDPAFTKAHLQLRKEIGLDGLASLRP